MQRVPGSLDAPRGEIAPHICIEDDELDAAGVSSAELAQMIAGPDRGRVRTWLESLPVEQRVIFVLRAVAAIPAGETAALLAAYGGPGAAAWTADQVREGFPAGAVLAGLATAACGQHALKDSGFQEFGRAGRGI